MNIIEKVLAGKAHLDIVIPRERVSLEPSVVYVSEAHAMSVINTYHEAGYDKICHPTQTIFKFCSRVQTSDLMIIKHFCEVNGLRLVEEDQDYLRELFGTNGLVVVGVDSAINVLGANGAIPLLISPTSMAHCLGTGKVEVVIPETVYIEISGQLSIHTSVENLCEYLLDYFKDSLIGLGIIIGGSTLESLKDEERQKVTRFISESGASLGIISPFGPFGQVESVVKIKAHHIPVSI